MKIIANARMLKVHLDRRRGGRILTDDESLNRVRLARVSLEITGAPLRYRPVPQSGNPTDPTPEWQRRAGDFLVKDTMGKGDVAPLKRYRVKHVLESQRSLLEIEFVSALERFLQDSVYAERIAVSDPNRGGGFASPGSRLGGLGNVPQHVRDGHARFEWTWARLDPMMTDTANALVFRELLKPDGTPFSMEDFGGRLFPNVGDKNRRWGVSAGALRALGSNLVWLYSQCPIRVRKVDETERALETLREFTP